MLHRAIAVVVVVIEDDGEFYHFSGEEAAEGAMDASMVATTSHHSSSIAPDNLLDLAEEANHVDNYSGSSIIYRTMGGETADAIHIDLVEARLRIRRVQHNNNTHCRL